MPYARPPLGANPAAAGAAGLGRLNPAANAQRDNITAALMNIAQPPPRLQLPTMPPSRGQMGMPPVPVPGAPPQGLPPPQAQPLGGLPAGPALPQTAPQSLPLTPGVPPQQPMLPGAVPSPMQAAGAPGMMPPQRPPGM